MPHEVNSFWEPRLSTQPCFKFWPEFCPRWAAMYRMCQILSLIQLWQLLYKMLTPH